MVPFYVLGFCWLVQLFLGYPDTIGWRSTTKCLDNRNTTNHSHKLPQNDSYMLYVLIIKQLWWEEWFHINTRLHSVHVMSTEDYGACMYITVCGAYECSFLLVAHLDNQGKDSQGATASVIFAIVESQLPLASLSLYKLWAFLLSLFYEYCWKIKLQETWQWRLQHTCTNTFEQVTKGAARPTYLSPFQHQPALTHQTYASRCAGVGYAVLELHPDDHRFHNVLI